MQASSAVPATDPCPNKPNIRKDSVYMHQEQGTMHLGVGVSGVSLFYQLQLQRFSVYNKQYANEVKLQFPLPTPGGVRGAAKMFESKILPSPQAVGCFTHQLK